MIRRSHGVGVLRYAWTKRHKERGNMGVDLEAIRKRVQELQHGRRNSNVQLWKPKDAGEYVVRGLPWPAKMTKAGEPFVERWFYYIGDSFGVLTPSQFGKPDPIKEFIDSLYKSGTPGDKDIAKKLRPKMQAYLPIVVKKGPKVEDTGKVLIWSINKFLYSKMLNWFLDEDVGDYLDPETGIDIKVTFTSSGRMFRGKPVLDSDVALARKASKLAETSEQTKALLDGIPNIEDMNEQKTYEELEKMLQKWLDGGGTEGDKAAETNEGGDRGAATGGDALDELVNDVKGTSTPAPAEKPVEEKPKAAKQPKSKKKDEEEEPVVEKQSLEDAFAELMTDDD